MGRESRDLTDPILIPGRRGAARPEPPVWRRFLHPWNGVLGWIQNSNFLTNEQRGQTDAHKFILWEWDCPYAAANPAR